MKLSFYMFFNFSIIIIILLFSSVILAVSPNSNDKHVWNLKNVDIHTIIDELAKETGKNFVVSSSLTGKVTFISGYPLTSEEVYQAFLALLQASGFEAVQEGPV